MGDRYLGVSHPGLVAVLRRLSQAPREWFDTPDAERLLARLRDLAAKEGSSVAAAVEDALAPIAVTA